MEKMKSRRSWTKEDGRYVAVTSADGNRWAEIVELNCTERRRNGRTYYGTAYSIRAQRWDEHCGAWRESRFISWAKSRREALLEGIGEEDGYCD